ASNVGRVPGLVPVRYARMAPSPFTFFRGSAMVQARDLRETPASGIIVQLCGDCHIMNFGGFATPERNLIFDINDFDETFPGPWEWDVKRLTVSLVLAARDRGFSKSVARDAVLAAVASYRQRLTEYAGYTPLDIWYTQLELAALSVFFQRNADVFGDLEQAERFARGRTSETAFPKLATVQNGNATIVDHPPLVYHFHEHVADWDKLIGKFLEQYRESLSPDRRLLFDRYRFEDLAIKVVGIGSVGTRCTIALFIADETDPLFLQAKEARRSVLQAPDAKSPFADEGERVVYGQRLMQAASDIFLGWAEFPGSQHNYYMRQLRDMKVSVDIERFRPRTLIDYGAICGWVLARGHAKGGDGVAIAGYLGKGDVFDRAIAAYAPAYADQVEADFDAFQSAIHSGRIQTATGEFTDQDFLP
ncbi:MAG TPA: DUF2252 domain-containing protein, partial [Candidatus Acidoferrum sp.]|nr:DUF2252 domain-containing protein [Candidatus Acidoferrum sp.]